jgi:hypothetical protein
MVNVGVKQLIDFSEIESHTKFEQFAADLLGSLGYEIVARPAEGADGGKDLIVADILEGRHGRQRVKYLVSCKHKLSSAVNTNDEQDIESRVRSHHCDAFMGFYSNHVTQGLRDKVEGLKSAERHPGYFDIVLIEDADIHRHLLELPDGPRLVQQWFPRGHMAYIHTVSESYVYRNRPVMHCADCGADLLQDFSGVVFYEATHEPAVVPTTDPERDGRHRYHILDIRPYCSGHAPRLPFRNASMLFDLRDLIEPKKYIKRVYEDVKFMYAWPPYFATMDVFRKWNHLVHILYYFVARGQHSPEPLPPLADLQLRLFDNWKL